MKTDRYEIRRLGLICVMIMVVLQPASGDTSTSHKKNYAAITAGFHKRLEAHPEKEYKGHVIGLNGAENPLDNHTDPRTDAEAGFNAEWTLGYIEAGFGATCFIGEYVYTARDNLTVDFTTLNDESADQVDLSKVGPECERRLYTDTLYDATSESYSPQDSIYTLNISQEPEPPGEALNAGGFIVLTPSIYISSWNTLDDSYVFVSCTNGTQLELGGDPMGLS